MADEDPLLFSTEGSVGIITFNRPAKLNALTMDMFDKIQEALAECRRPGYRAVVIRGAGTSFSAGDDVSPNGFMGGRQTEGPVGYGHRNPSDYFSGPGPYWLFQALRYFPKPVIAGIQGHCAGAAADLALACDFRVAAEDCNISFPYVKLGLVGGTWLLQRYVGLGRATDLVLTGRVIDAATALDWGLVNTVTQPDTLVEETLKLARRLAVGPTKAIGYSKEAINRGMNTDLQAGYEYMVWANGFAANAADAAVARQAFLDKRPPEFTGQ